MEGGVGGLGWRGKYLPNTRQENVVDAAQFHVDFETQIGQGLWSCLVHILGLYTLSGQSKHDVTYTLHLSCEIPNNIPLALHLLSVYIYKFYLTYTCS